MEIWVLLMGVLRLAWIVWILPILIAGLPFSGLGKFHQLVLVFSGRGKTSKSSKLTVPQKFFSHFYILGVVWTSVLLASTWVYAHKVGSVVSESTSYSSVASYLTGGSHIFSFNKPHTFSAEYNYGVWTSVFLLVMMEIQVLRRLYESLYVFKYSSTARLHILGYFTGIFFYTAAPLSLCCNFLPEVFTYIVNRVIEFIVEGKNRMPPIEFQWSAYVSPLVKLGWCQWIGALIFAWGWFHQLRCHAILGNLREKKEQSDEYAIPRGDWFEVASSAHYLAEIVLYVGILVASGGLDVTVWLLFAFVVTNLVFAAAETHRWYHRKFDDYPSNRRAIIPFVY